MSYQIDKACGNFLIVEPFGKSKVLQVTEVETIFKIISFGGKVGKSENPPNWIIDTYNIGDLIIVEKGSVKKTIMGDQDVWYIYESDVVAKVKNV